MQFCGITLFISHNVKFIFCIVRNLAFNKTVVHSPSDNKVTFGNEPLAHYYQPL